LEAEEQEGGSEAMSRKAKKNGDPVAQTLESILLVLKDLLILECAKTGMTRPELRAIVAADNNRISRIARHVKPTKGSEEGD